MRSQNSRLHTDARTQEPESCAAIRNLLAPRRELFESSVLQLRLSSGLRVGPMQNALAVDQVGEEAD